MSLRKIVRHELVEVVIPQGSTATRFLIPDLPNLREVHLWGLSVYVSEDIPTAIQNQAAVLPLDVVAKTAFITLVNYGGKEFLKQAPAVNFKTVYNEDMQLAPTNTNNIFDTDKKCFTGQKVNYPKSYIEFSAPPASPDETQVFLFSVYYSLPIAQEEAQGNFSFRNKA